jgi:hypothetical protein
MIAAKRRMQGKGHYLKRARLMKARQLIDRASYGPDTLKAMGKAFDAAWLAIEDNFGNDPRDIEKARLRLARAVLSVAAEDTRNVADLKTGALEAMALGYRDKLLT